ncbi:ribonuclease HI [Microvirga sp. BT689]|uniref:ribonuclease H family protein n=1 Tax=Microvirga arvi TaxID=2778731 RepID=UPI00194F35FB|nr:ribonuclease H [Microvirga arvi]MBM6580173.1 ribonuclease HI [Microvirga arvi]
MLPHAIIYSDGACIGKAALRPGGWAAIILIGQAERIILGSHPATTITAMELTAVIHALEALPPGSRAIVYTDSAAVVAGITERLPWWRSRGWRTIKGHKVQDRVLWQQLAELAATRQVSWVWVKGHAGNPDNERVDTLARAQARSGFEQEPS